MMTLCREITKILLLTIATCAVYRDAWPQNDDPIFDAKGFQRDYFSALPFEHIDTATGGLTLTFTDLVRPGNEAGATTRMMV